jgi:type IV secretory pathway VirD2 relaxase
MADRDDNRFRPKVGPPKSGGRAPNARFISRVIKATNRAGPKGAGRFAGSRKAARLGRGHVAAQLAARRQSPRARRVVIKTRLVNLRTASARSSQRHLRYIEGGALTPERGRGRLYDANNEEVDGDAFRERGTGDRHQFRFIVSPEDGVEIEDLKTYTRDLMSQMERDLGTRLDWVAADHWDTDEPHTHIVLRGKDDTGRDLVIARDYISDGMRARASEIATRWLGVRTELEIREGLAKEVGQERWTTHDRSLQREAKNGLVTFHEEPGNAQARLNRSMLIGRLDRLTEMGLATKLKPFSYTLSATHEATLRAMGERGDIIRTMQRAMGQAQRQYEIFDHTDPRTRVVGRIAGKGLVDEFDDRGYLIVDGTDGRAHYVALPKTIDLEGLPIRGIIEIRGGASERPADRNIARSAAGGIYRRESHLAAVSAQGVPGQDPEEFVAAHVRRLEALRRAGIVERVEDGVWRLPSDLVIRGQAYDTQRLGGARVELRSHLALERQTRALGATWLDQQLAKDSVDLSAQGFGAEARNALRQRLSFLVDEGLAERRGDRIVFRSGWLQALREREIEATAKALSTETGLAHRPIKDGQTASGVYQRSLNLASGRFALLEDATGFSLVPWRPVIEKRLGQSMSAVVRGEFISWQFGRNQDLSL